MTVISYTKALKLYLKLFKETLRFSLKNIFRKQNEANWASNAFD